MYTCRKSFWQHGTLVRLIFWHARTRAEALARIRREMARARKIMISLFRQELAFCGASADEQAQAPRYVAVERDGPVYRVSTTEPPTAAIKRLRGVVIPCNGAWRDCVWYLEEN